MSDFDLIAVDQMARLRADLSSGNLDGICSTLSELRYSLDDETFQAKMVPLLREAVDKNLYQLVECLLQNHVALSSQLVLKATMNASYQTLEVILTHGWDINTPIDSNTPAALAFSFHDFKLTKWFLAHGADPNRRCYEHTDRTPLSVAFEKAPFAIIELLLDFGASLQHGQVMHYAAMRELDDRLEVLRYLLDHHHPLNEVMYQNCGDEYYFHMYSGIGTPLHYAAGKGILDSVTFLVQHGASIEIRDPLGQTAADWARRYGHSAVFNFLQQFSAESNTEGNLQFTDAPGRHFKTASLQEVIRKNGFRLV